MFECDSPGDLVTRFCGTLLDSCRLFQKVCCGGGFGNEGECAVGLNRDESWDRYACLDMRCFGIEFLAEVHGFDTTGTKSRTDGWSWCCFPSTDEDTLVKNNR